MQQTTKRPIYRIAQEILLNWPAPNYAAKPYLIIMLGLTDPSDSYGYDSAKSIILYFLSNASSFRGPEAKRLKSELKTILN